MYASLWGYNNIYTYIHTTYTFIPRGWQKYLKYSETPTFEQNYLAMRNTTDVTGGKPVAV
jgi:hypothetical protein